MSKEYKGLLVNYDVISESSPDIKYLYELSERDIALLLSQLTYLRWPTRYTNLTATKQELDRLIGGLEHKLMETTDCMIDCNEVEDCLDASPTITNITTNVTNVTNSVTVIETEIDNIEQEIQDVAQTDGNVYPPSPDKESEPDAACGAAYYLVSKTRTFIADLEAAAGTYGTLQDALEAYLAGVLNLIFSPFYTLLAGIFGGVPPVSVLPDYDAQTDDMREYLYCNGFSKSAFETYVRTLTNGDAIADFIACIGLGSWQSWIAIGSQDDTHDCSLFCAPGTWCYYFDFSISQQGWTKLQGNYPYSEVGETGFGGTTGLPVEIEIAVNAYVTEATIEMFGIGSNSNGTLQVRNDGVLIYDNSLGDNDRTFPINDDVGVLKIYGLRQFGWGMNAVKLSGDGINPFGPDNCP